MYYHSYCNLFAKLTMSRTNCSSPISPIISLCPALATHRYDVEGGARLFARADTRTIRKEKIHPHPPPRRHFPKALTHAPHCITALPPLSNTTPGAGVGQIAVGRAKASSPSRTTDIQPVVNVCGAARRGRLRPTFADVIPAICPTPAGSAWHQPCSKNH